MKSPDQFLCDSFQTCYDYLWDKWNVRIGSFRFFWISPIMTFMIIDNIEYTPKTVYSVIKLFIYILLYGVFVLLHLFAQNYLQKTYKNHVLLNKPALKWKNDWMRVPIILATIFFGLATAFMLPKFPDKIAVIIMFGILVLYGYSMTIMVRPRKEIKQKEKHHNILFNPT